MFGFCTVAFSDKPSVESSLQIILKVFNVKLIFSFAWKIFSSDFSKPQLLSVIISRRDIVWGKHMVRYSVPSNSSQYIFIKIILIWEESFLSASVNTFALLNSWHIQSLAWRLREGSWKQHESCKYLCFSFTWCCYWGLYLEGKICFSSETVICVKHNAMCIYKNCLIFLKQPYTYGIIHRRL